MMEFHDNSSMGAAAAVAPNSAESVNEAKRLHQVITQAESSNNVTALTNSLEELCTMLCVGGELFVRSLDAPTFVPTLLHTLAHDTMNVRVLSLRALASIADVVPRACGTMIQLDVVPIVLRYAKMKQFLAANEPFADELLKCLQIFSLDAHKPMLVNRAVSILVDLIGLSERHRYVVLCCVVNLFAAARPRDLSDLEVAIPELVVLLDAKLETIEAAGGFATTKEEDIASKICTCYAHLFDRVGVNDDIAAKLLNKSAMPVVPQMRRMLKATGVSTATNLRRYALGVLTTVFGASPQHGLRAFAKHHVLEEVCSAAISLTARVTDKVGLSAAALAQQLLNDGANGGNGNGNGHNGGAGGGGGSGANATGKMALLAREHSINLLLEFLLFVIPRAPETCDHSNVILPYHAWLWQDDFHNQNEYDENNCLRLESEYQVQRRSRVFRPFEVTLGLRPITVSFEHLRHVNSHGTLSRPFFRNSIMTCFFHRRASALAEQCTCFARKTEEPSANEVDSPRSGVAGNNNNNNEAAGAPRPVSPNQNNDGGNERDAQSSTSSRVRGGAGGGSWRRIFSCCLGGDRGDDDSDGQGGASEGSPRRSRDALELILLSESFRALFLTGDTVRLLVSVLVPSLVSLANSIVDATGIRHCSLLLLRCLSVAVDFSVVNALAAERAVEGVDGQASSICQTLSILLRLTSRNLVQRMCQQLVSMAPPRSVALLGSIHEVPVHCPPITSWQWTVQGETFMAACAAVQQFMFLLHDTAAGLLVQHRVLPSLVSANLALSSALSDLVGPEVPSASSASVGSLGLDGGVSGGDGGGGGGGGGGGAVDDDGGVGLPHVVPNVHDRAGQIHDGGNGHIGALNGANRNNNNSSSIFNSSGSSRALSTVNKTDPRMCQLHPTWRQVLEETLTMLKPMLQELMRFSTPTPHQGPRSVTAGGSDWHDALTSLSLGSITDPWQALHALHTQITQDGALSIQSFHNDYPSVLPQLVTAFRALRASGGSAPPASIPVVQNTIAVFMQHIAAFVPLSDSMFTDPVVLRRLNNYARPQPTQSTTASGRIYERLGRPLHLRVMLSPNDRVTIDGKTYRTISNIDGVDDEFSFFAYPFATVDSLAAEVLRRLTNALQRRSRLVSLTGPGRSSAHASGPSTPAVTSPVAPRPAAAGDPSPATSAASGGQFPQGGVQRPVLVPLPPPHVPAPATESADEGSSSSGSSSEDDSPQTVAASNGVASDAVSASGESPASGVVDRRLFPARNSGRQGSGSGGSFRNAASGAPTSEAGGTTAAPAVGTTSTAGTAASAEASLPPAGGPPPVTQVAFGGRSAPSPNGRGVAFPAANRPSQSTPPPAMATVPQKNCEVLLLIDGVPLRNRSATLLDVLCAHSSTARLMRIAIHSSLSTQRIALQQAMHLWGCQHTMSYMVVDDVPMEPVAVAASTFSFSDGSTSGITGGGGRGGNGSAVADQQQSRLASSPVQEYLNARAANRHHILTLSLELLSALFPFVQRDGDTSPDARKLHSSVIHEIASQAPTFLFPSLAPLCHSISHRQEVGLEASIGTYVLWNYPMVFPFALRLNIFEFINSGMILLSLKAQGAAAANQMGRTSGTIVGMSWFSPPQATGSPASGREMRRVKVTVVRQNLLASASQTLLKYSGCPVSFEVEFRDEPGTGLGPTMEFFFLCGKELKNAKLGLWRATTAPGATAPVSSVGASALATAAALGQVSGFSSRSSSPPPPQMMGGALDAVWSSRHSTPAATPRDARSPRDDSVFASPVPGTPRSANGIVSLDGSGAPLYVQGWLYPAFPLDSEQLAHFATLGRLCGRALKERRHVDVDLHPLFLRAVLGESLLQDAQANMMMLDPQMETSLQLLEAMSSEELAASDLVFTLPDASALELIPDGAATEVNRSNVATYVRLVREQYLHRQLAAPLQEFLNGLSTAFPALHLRLFTTDDLALLLCGAAGKVWTDAASFMADVVCDHGYTATSLPVLYLAETVAAWDGAMQRQFLLFISGSNCVPLGGIHPKITVVRKDADVSPARPVNPVSSGQPAFAGSDFPIDAVLPTVNTCFHYLKLPPYSSARTLRDRLAFAVLEGQGSFQLS